MSKVFLFAFVAVAGVAAAGVDYVNQSHRAGVGFGQMSAAGYVATVSGRLTDQKASLTATVVAADTRGTTDMADPMAAKLRLLEASLEALHSSKRISDADYEAARGKIAAYRAGLTTAAPAPAGTGATAGLAGALMGMLSGSKAESATVAEAVVEPAAPVEIKVNRASGGLGSGICDTTGAFKRCKLGN